MTANICIIGAGSAEFSLSLIRDLCLTPSLNGSTLTLMDIDPARLDNVELLLTRYAAEVGFHVVTRKTTDRREGLAGAEFVINTGLIGGHSVWRKGWDIAETFGYRFGGSLHVMHDEPFWGNWAQMRFFDAVAQDMLDICPHAWLLQVANPVLEAVTYFGRHRPELKMVGLCHGFAGVYKLAKVLGLDREKLTFEIPGVNHTVFLTKCFHDGEDVYPLLDRWIAEESTRYWESSEPSNGMHPAAIDLYHRFGLFPIGDTCEPGGGAWPWWYHTDAATERHWKEDPAGWWQRWFARAETSIASIHRAVHDRAQPVSAAFPPVHSGEVMVPMIDAIANDTPRVLIGNVLNSGNFVPGVPLDFGVEIPLHVSKRGIQGIQTTPLPPAVIAHILHDRVTPVNLEIDAFRTGNRTRLLEIIQCDPWTHSLDQAGGFLDAILAMPENADMAAHFAN